MKSVLLENSAIVTGAVRVMVGLAVRIRAVDSEMTCVNDNSAALGALLYGCRAAAWHVRIAAGTSTVALFLSGKAAIALSIFADRVIYLAGNICSGSDLLDAIGRAAESSRWLR